MAVVRVSILLDRDDVSFQAIHRLLKDPSTVAALLQAFEERHGSDVLSPSRNESIEEFRQIYGEIDWKGHGRLVHLRNLGIAHLTPEEMTKSVTFADLRTMVEVIGRWAFNKSHARCFTIVLQNLALGFVDIHDQFVDLAPATSVPPEQSLKLSSHSWSISTMGLMPTEIGRPPIA